MPPPGRPVPPRPAAASGAPRGPDGGNADSGRLAVIARWQLVFRRRCVDSACIVSVPSKGHTPTRMTTGVSSSCYDLHLLSAPGSDLELLVDFIASTKLRPIPTPSTSRSCAP